MRSFKVVSRALLAASVLALLSAAAPQWPQDSSDIAADPAIRFGSLRSGMHYAIMKNGTPSGEVSIRLRIGAGSLEEGDAQQGLAHFLEHMAFRGSSHVSDGDVFKMLERLGLRAGADTNASTSQTQTLYQFDLPNADDATLETGLMLSREIVSELILDPTAFNSERGPVLSEERLRDSPGTRAFEAQNRFLLKGQLAPDRLPIGKVDIIKNAPVDQVADFYHDFYRPERATVIVAGDIDPDAIEAKIKAKFGDWMPSGEGKPDPDLGQVLTRGQETSVFVETGAPQFASVSWMGPYDSAPDTKAHRTHDRFEGIALAIMNQRFAQAAQNADPPFQSAGVSHGNTARSASIAMLQVGYAGDHWQKALIEADKIRRQVLQQGVTQAEVDRQVTAILAGARAGVAAASTRTSRALAGAIAGTLNQNGVFNSPESGLAMVEADLKGLSVETVNAALRSVFSGNGPLLFLSSPTAVADGETALATAFADAERSVLTDAAPPEVKIWPYTDFGTPGAVAETRTVDDLGVTFIRFANGVKLTVKPTKFRADQVSVSVTLAGGELAFPRDRMVIDTGAFIGGGLEAMPYIDIRRALTGKIYSIGFDVGDDAFALAGNTRPADLDTQLQVLTAYLTKPGWRPELYQQGLTSMADSLTKLDTSAMSLFGARWPGLLHGGDPRWGYPNLDEIHMAKLDEVKALLAPALATSPIEVTIVGDISVDAAAKSVAATFGALPARGQSPYSPANRGDVRFPDPTPQPIVLQHAGRADQGVAAIAWPTTDFFADKETAARRLVMDIIRSRLFDQLRVADGATYSPQTTAQASMTFPGYGYIAAFAEIPPQKTQLFFDAVDKVAADLAEHGPSADEFERARKPELDALDKAVETNAYWGGFLSGAQTDERRLQVIRDAKPGLQQVTPADVQRVAAKYLTSAKAWKLLVVPKPQ
jgi:zinc protease